MANIDVPLTAAMRGNLLLLQKTDKGIQVTQNKLATGNKINTALDGPTEFFAAKNLNTRSKDLMALKDAMGQAVSTIKAADTGISSVENLLEQMRGLTTAALGALGKDSGSMATRKTLAQQFNTLKDQIDKVVKDSGYQGKNLLVGNGMRLDSTSSSRLDINTYVVPSTGASITAVSNARTTNVTAIDTYSIRVSGDGAIEGNSTDLVNVENERGLVGLKLSGTMSSTLGAFDDIKIQTSGNTGRLRSFTLSDGAEAHVVKYFDNSQTAEAETVRAAASNTAQISQVSFSGTVEEGDIYTVKVAGVTFKYTATAAVAAMDNDTARAQIGTAIATSIQNAMTSGKLPAADFATVGVSSLGTVTVTGSPATSYANDFIISASTTNALSLRISESFASGAVVSFTIDRLAMEQAGNGSSVIEKNINLQISVTSLSGQVVTRDAMYERGQGKLADGENAFAFDTGTVRLKINEQEIQQAASVQMAANLVTTQVADANTQNDLTVNFNERGTSFIGIQSQNLQTNGQGMRVDYAQNDWLDRSDVAAAVEGLDYAKQYLRDAAQRLSTNLNIVTTRENYTKEFSDVLTEGANKLTLADQNEEGTKLLMLQTRQQLGTISLSIANQQQQAILRLF